MEESVADGSAEVVEVEVGAEFSMPHLRRLDMLRSIVVV